MAGSQPLMAMACFVRLTACSFVSSPNRECSCLDHLRACTRPGARIVPHTPGSTEEPLYAHCFVLKPLHGVAAWRALAVRARMRLSLRRQ